MERLGFVFTVLAGFLSCGLLMWQGFEGAGADWVSGFLCVLWSLLMLARLMSLTSPNLVATKPHLAQKIIHALHAKLEVRRSNILQHSFSKSFAAFVLLGFLLCVWQLGFSLYQAIPDAATSQFLKDNGYVAWFSAATIFDWGRAFSNLLCLSMMGFLLRSYAADITAVRSALLIFAGYIAAGFILFFTLSKNWGFPDSISFMGTMPQNASVVLEILLQQSGVLGLCILAAMIAVPVAYVWAAAMKDQQDPVILTCGSIAFLALFGSFFLGLHPALGGFAFLCAMALFLAWGASEKNDALLSA